MALRALQGPVSGTPVGGTGTPNTIPRWTGPSTLGDSLLIQTSNAITMTSTVNARLDFGVRNFSNGGSAYSQLFAGNDTDVLAGLLRNSSGNAGYAGPNSLNLWTVGAFPIGFVTSNTLRWQINSSGHFLAGADNSYDIGASGATRPRTVYVGTSFDASASGAGLKLPATPGNADTQTLDCYLDGGASGGATWTPVDNSGAGLTFTVTSARYMRIGRLVLASFDITFPATASVAQATISLPVTAQAVWQGASIGYGPNIPGLSATVINGDLNFWTYLLATTNAALSGTRLIVSMSYFAN